MTRSRLTGGPKGVSEDLILPECPVDPTRGRELGRCANPGGLILKFMLNLSVALNINPHFYVCWGNWPEVICFHLQAVWLGWGRRDQAFLALPGSQEDPGLLPLDV